MRSSRSLHDPGTTLAVVTDVAPARRADAQRSIATILEAAREVLAVDPNAELQAIVERSGLNRSTVYRHFPRRTDLVSALYGRYLETLTAAVRTLDPHAPDALAELRRVTVEVLRIADHFRPFRYSPTFGDAFATYREQFVPPVRAMMDRGQRDGVLRQNLTIDELVLGWGVSVPNASMRVTEGSWTVDEAADFMLVLIGRRR